MKDICEYLYLIFINLNQYIFLSKVKNLWAREWKIINYCWDIRGEFLLHHPYRTILSTSYVSEIHIEDALSLATGYLGGKHIRVSREMPSIAAN